MTTTTTARNAGLDTLRALAIALVFANHYMLFVSGAPTLGWFGEIGWSGVDLFFALSGYLIGNQILGAIRRGQQGTRRFSLPRFYARRLLRTLPNFYVVLALFACWPYFRMELVLPPLWQFLSFTQNIGLQAGTAFSHAWSLCVEEQFYFLLPAVAMLIAACRKSLVLAWLAVAAALIAGMLIRSYLWRNHVAVAPDGGRAFYTLIYYSSLCRFDELVIGVALALLKNYHTAIWARLTAHGNWMLLAGCAALALVWSHFLENHYGYAMTVYGYPLLGLSYALLLLAALSPGALLQKVRIPGAASIALWSYAIYLVHKTLCMLLRVPLQAQGWEPDHWASVLLMAGASVLAGCLLYQLVERPFMALRDRYVPSHEVQAVAPLAAGMERSGA
ncbi:acyltransferase family protein [Duganella qianjiadongensis]|uniref:Acyltransferase family protein n=1 Tax=Duganella qianjiadongensis TaxID=2692176 RepID=A0ABW9VJK4_9BURK|nr:acyltransferase [Duganella qianjiadongensis]MYM37787.1 acyltransferase family protein [Duganella qianjiadongensis]